jgi:heme exporter protein C
MWVFFHKLGSPRWFYQISGKWLPWFAVVATVLLVVGAVWGLAFAPPDFKQGNSYRILFIHVPASGVAMSGYMMMATVGAIHLIWKMKLAEVVLKCAAYIGAGITLVSFVTGAIWGKPTWGTWFLWDARITSTLVLLFLYLGIIALYEAFENKEAAVKACAILSLVGTVNLPIIYWSVEWWNSLHQPATIKFTEASSMHPDMLKPLLMMVVGLYCFYATVLMMHMRVEILKRERNTQWVKEIVAKAKV